MKLLSPAGNIESLKTAIYNGADEVYLGVNDFNARNNIDGFTLDNLGEAVEFAHIYGVRVFLAINILFTNQELTSALETLVKAYNLGVDAFIIQDLGFANLVKTTYPEIEIHASTQMGIHNLEGVRELEKIGFKRVVLARETPLSEIKRIRDNSNIEIEYFVHGALCVSFSGNCYLSSYLHNASGNRGRCKQLCRLPYALNFKGKEIKKGYLLSAKDFNMISRLKDLDNAGVTSLKIEGRARRPYYVGAVTSEYRKALDGLDFNKSNLDLAFNREFTEGYFNGNKDMISGIQNHIGISLGEVEKVVNGKKFNEIIIKSKKVIAPKSVLKFLDGNKEFTTITAYDVKGLNNDRYLVTTTQSLKVGLKVNLISNILEENNFLQKTAKREIEITLSLKENQKIKASCVINGKLIVEEGDLLLKPKSRPLSKEETLNCFEKNEFFSPIITFDAFEQVFMVKSSLNEFRRNFYQRVKETLTKKERNLVVKKIIVNKTINKLEDFCFTEKSDGEYENKIVIYSPEIYDIQNLLRFKENCIKQDKIPYLDTPNFALEKDVKLLKEIVEKTGIGIVANNYYALSLTNDVIIGGGLNVYNQLTANYLGKPFISSENGLVERRDFAYMTLRHCPIKTHVGGSCGDCKYQKGYTYSMENGKTFSLKRKKLTDCTFYLVEEENEI